MTCNNDSNTTLKKTSGLTFTFDGILWQRSPRKTNWITEQRITNNAFPAVNYFDAFFFFFAPHVILWYLRIPLLLFIDQERSINRVITPVYPTVHSSWLVVHPHRITNEDGRCPGLITKENFTPGVYKLYFETAGYWASLGETCFYPYVEVRILLLCVKCFCASVLFYKQYRLTVWGSDNVLQVLCAL